MKKRLLTGIIPLLLGAGCSHDEQLPAPADTAGSIELLPCAVATVESQTRATAELPLEYLPTSDDFRLVIQGKAESGTAGYLMEWEQFRDYDMPQIPGGYYTATISFGDPRLEGVSACCFEGSLDFKIFSGQIVQHTVTAALSNSAISHERSEWFDKYYTQVSFVVRTEAGNEFEFATPRTHSAPIFVRPGSRLWLRGEAVKAQNGVKVTFPEKEIGTTTARTWHRIRIDASQAGEGSFTIRLDDTLTPVTPQEIDLSETL